MLGPESPDERMSRAHRMIGDLCLGINRLELHKVEQAQNIERLEAQHETRDAYIRTIKHFLGELEQSVEANDGKVLITNGNGLLGTLKSLIQADV